MITEFSQSGTKTETFGKLQQRQLKPAVFDFYSRDNGEPFRRYPSKIRKGLTPLMIQPCDCRCLCPLYNSSEIHNKLRRGPPAATSHSYLFSACSQSVGLDVRCNNSCDSAVQNIICTKRLGTSVWMYLIKRNILWLKS